MKQHFANVAEYKAFVTEESNVKENDPSVMDRVSKVVVIWLYLFFFLISFNLLRKLQRALSWGSYVLSSVL